MSLLGIEPKRSLGQNFLVSDSVVDRIIAASDPSSFTQTVEIGPGLGALTDHLIKQSQNLQLIELDKTFAQFWREQKITVHESDALKFSWDQFNWEEGKHLLVSNLPYQISSRLLVDLSLRELSFERMVLMFQKEVAQRIMAQPSTGSYGLLSVVAQLFWQVSFLLEAGAVDFTPKPNVASRVLIFKRRKQMMDSSLRSDFFSFLKKSFTNRRKKLLPKLTGYRSREQLEACFEFLSLQQDVRAEKLSPDQLIELYLRLKTE